ncbi:MAG: hypothetical protein HKN16_02200 [Saprospiraceae bacterium]|nr:hypothetical protein [Saprospiraceae bacterium]
MKHLSLFVTFLAITFFATSGLMAQNLVTQQAPLPCLNKTFSIVANMVRDSLGMPNTTEAEIQAAVDSLNKDFEPICVKFEVCEFRFVNNFQYDDIEDTDELNEMFAFYNQERRINMYLISGIPEPFCGMATLNGITMAHDSKPGIAIVKGDCLLAPSRTLSHEIGHFFGLLHTFEGSDGPNPELVDGSNCATAGDLICDTPADPYVAGDSQAQYVDPTLCRFIRQIKDSNDDWFVPDVGNIMSYYQAECACGFTYEQLLTMANNYSNSDRDNW